MNILFQQEGRIGKEYDRRHIVYEGIFEEDYKGIEINFEYSPKLVESDEKAEIIIKDLIDKQIIGEEKEKVIWDKYKNLKNLVTISFDDKNGFRGCAHRHDKEQSHIISQEYASPGFIKGLVPKGAFKVILSVHALVTDECFYKVKIIKRGEECD
ncbi:hypothetical protein [Clostridium ganghwense]|uniref:Uncharacterized protein n=1 Tax=Clostridium ganghwense TaxID=312089 RepID=A0ABT4CRK7_9CLOT|nr:hypothetical protein [Clostridium ganghwense]MCY6371068.1 hypothetical protein [Clostridium ganghwense]